MTFKPTSTLERHQKYFDAFLIYEKTTLGGGEKQYLDCLTKFIFDPNISHENEDDIQFFKDLLFESWYGKVHIYYYEWVLSKLLPYGFPQSIRILSRYADFLGVVSTMFLEDFYNAICRHENKEIAKCLFAKLSPVNRVHFVKMIDKHSEIVKLIPKLKLYVVFS